MTSILALRCASLSPAGERVGERAGPFLIPITSARNAIPTASHGNTLRADPFAAATHASIFTCLYEGGGPLL